MKIFNDRVYSTDNLRVSRFILKSDLGIDILLPKENVPSLLKFPDLTEWAIIIQNKVPSWVCFRNPETGFVCGSRLVIGNFPKSSAIENFFSMEGEEFRIPEDLKEKVLRAGKFVEGIIDEARIITVMIGENEIKLIAKKETGILTQISDIEYSDQNIVFHIVPTLFEQILNRTNKITLVKRNEGSSFVSFIVGDFSHVLQVRLGEEDFDE